MADLARGSGFEFTSKFLWRKEPVLDLNLNASLRDLRALSRLSTGKPRQPVTSASTGMPLAATRSWTCTKLFRGAEVNFSPLSLLADLKVLLFSQYVVCVVCGVKVLCFVQSRPSAFVN